jgi:hypothetical protein
MDRIEGDLEKLRTDSSAYTSPSSPGLHPTGGDAVREARDLDERRHVVVDIEEAMKAMSPSQLKSLVYLLSRHYPRSSEGTKDQHGVVRKEYLYDQAVRVLAAHTRTWSERTWSRLGVLANSSAMITGTVLVTFLALWVKGLARRGVGALSEGAWDSTFGQLPMALNWPVAIPWWAGDKSAGAVDFAATLGVFGLGGVFSAGTLADAISRVWDVDPTTAKRIVQQYARSGHQQIARSRKASAQADAPISSVDDDAAEYKRLRDRCEDAGAATADDDAPEDVVVSPRKRLSLFRRLLRGGRGGSHGAQPDFEASDVKQEPGTQVSPGTSPQALKARARRCSSLTECLWLPPPNPRCVVHPRLKLVLKKKKLPVVAPFWKQAPSGTLGAGRCRAGDACSQASRRSGTRWSRNARQQAAR